MDEQIDLIVNDKVAIYALAPLLCWTMAANEWLLQLIHAPRNPFIYLLMALAFTAWSSVRIFQVRRDLKHLKQGRDGERAVAEVLERLRESGARIFHDIPGENFNIDHAIVAPQGIYAVETKTWSKPARGGRISVRHGRLLRNGYPVDPNPIDQATAGAVWLQRLLTESTGKKLPVRSIVLFPGWYIEPLDNTAKERSWVLEPKALRSFLEREPAQLADSDVALAAFHLSRYIRART